MQKIFTDMRTTYYDMKNKNTGEPILAVIKETDITSSDPPAISKKRGLIVVKEPVTPKFVEDVLVRMSEDFVDKMLLSKFPREEARDTSNHPSSDRKFYLVSSFEDGQSLVDMAHTQGLLKRCNDGENRSLKILYEVTDLVKRFHEKRWLFRDLCAKNIYISSSTQKAYFTRLTQMVRLRTSSGVYQDTANDEMLYWYPREVFINQEFSMASDVYMLAMCFYEFFAIIEIIQEDIHGNILQRVPYADTPKTVILEKIFLGIKQRCPKGCPDWLYKIMVSCWSRDVTKRPTIEDIHKAIAQRLPSQGARETELSSASTENSPTACRSHSTNEAGSNLPRLPSQGARETELRSVSAANSPAACKSHYTNEANSNLPSLNRSVSDIDSTFTFRPKSTDIPSARCDSHHTSALSKSEKSRDPSQWRLDHQGEQCMNTNFKWQSIQLNTRRINPFTHKQSSEDITEKENPIFQSSSSTCLLETRSGDTETVPDGVNNESSAGSEDEIIIDNESDSE